MKTTQSFKTVKTIIAENNVFKDLQKEKVCIENVKILKPAIMNVRYREKTVKLRKEYKIGLDFVDFIISSTLYS